MLETRTTMELVQIAAAGGGFSFGAAVRRQDELVQIAAAAAKGGARVVLRELSTRRTDELVQIAAAGKGFVFFDD